ncbi:PREDICTED: protein ERGIC-53 [Ceratosolen solmsi marchali]|uniref:Protein ERGIC-53 n=1 Tax=Ceratosolen solmsi marchali TaxID=326594 RepID=A0AAJ6YT79_9HYME|nr:PREDICTED: protein ERGIC-53 [Ceratosolen solmsi marchali]
MSIYKVKMAAEVRWIVYLFLFLYYIYTSYAELPHRKFEYKYSFKPPYLAQKDGSVPFWEYGGNAIASSENIRIAPSLRSQKGAIWTKQAVNFDWWEIDIVFRITGRGRIGADGLALWYTTSKGFYNGTVFGSSDKWIGLGIFFDSFDNDNKRNNPFIMTILNDGSKIFDHANDGGTQVSAGCLRDFRNKPFATRAKIEYYQNSLTLLFHGGMTNNELDYEVCFRLENVFLPKYGYFGISAATGGLADDHDVLHILTTSLYPRSQITSNKKVSTEEELKLGQEYLSYQTKLERQKEEYHKEHPDERHEKEFEEWFESENQRELKQIFTGQMQISDTMRSINNKLDEVVGKQERVLSLISQIPLEARSHEGKIQSNQASQVFETIRRQEIDFLLTTQNNILSAVLELKSVVIEVQSKTDNILNNQARNPTAKVEPLSYDYQSFITEIRDGLNTLKRDVLQTNTKLNSLKLNCPAGNCLTTIVFIIFIAVQIIIILGYNIYRDNKEAQAKKFY